MSFLSSTTQISICIAFLYVKQFFLLFQVHLLRKNSIFVIGGRGGDEYEFFKSGVAARRRWRHWVSYSHFASSTEFCVTKEPKEEALLMMRNDG